MKEILLSLFSGIIGIFLTIGYQHFFASPTAISVYINDEKYFVTEAERVDIPIDNIELQNEINELEVEKSNLSKK